MNKLNRVSFCLLINGFFLMVVVASDKPCRLAWRMVLELPHLSVDPSRISYN